MGLIRAVVVVAVAAVVVHAQQPSTAPVDLFQDPSSLVEGISQFTAPATGFLQDAQAALQEQLDNAQQAVQNSLNNAQAAVQEGVGGAQEQLARLGAPIAPAADTDAAVVDASLDLVSGGNSFTESAIETVDDAPAPAQRAGGLFGGAALPLSGGMNFGGAAPLPLSAADPLQPLLRDAQAGLERTNSDLAGLLERTTASLTDLQSRLNSMTQQALSNIPTLQANAPVGRVFTNQPIARGGIRVVRDFLDSLARVRESETGMSGLQRLIATDGPAALEGTPQDSVFVQQVLAEARAIEAAQQAGGAPEAAAAAMSNSSTSAPAAAKTNAMVFNGSMVQWFNGSMVQMNATTDRDAEAANKKKRDAAAYRVPRSVFDSLCGSPLLNERGRVNFTDVDRAYALAHRRESDIRVPNGCIHGCVIGTGFFETVARTYGVERTQTLGAWQGKCFDNSNGKVANRIAVADRLGLLEPMKMFEGDLKLGESYFAPGEKSAVVDYSDYDHEFSSFRDEYREVYPGVYLGKMYAMPGTRMYGVLNVPADSPPIFAVNFLLLADDPADVTYIAPKTI